jgi:ribosomal protein S12 methylthiotransferase accessory factor YcaO
MTFERFKYKHRKLIEKGVIRFSPEHPNIKEIREILTTCKNEDLIKEEMVKKMYFQDYIIIDQLSENKKTILVKKWKLLSPQRDVIKLGYYKIQNSNIFIKLPGLN